MNWTSLLNSIILPVQYELQVIADDQVHQPNAVVFVEVTNVNDIAPVFEKPLYKVHDILEDDPNSVGKILTKVSIDIFFAFHTITITMVLLLI